MWRPLLRLSIIVLGFECADAGHLERSLCGEAWVLVRFGVAEYTLVFRREGNRGGRSARRAARHPWTVARPLQYPSRKGAARRIKHAAGLDELFAVPICSTLALDELAYERFLAQSGVLHDALLLLGELTLDDAPSAETVRRQIQSLVMAAEVQYIVDGMSA